MAEEGGFGYIELNREMDPKPSQQITSDRGEHLIHPRPVSDLPDIVGLGIGRADKDPDQSRAALSKVLEAE